MAYAERRDRVSLVIKISEWMFIKIGTYNGLSRHKIAEPIAISGIPAIFQFTCMEHLGLTLEPPCFLQYSNIIA